MAINIKFDLANNPETPTLILATRNGKKLGQLNARKIELSDKFNDASEITFVLHKTENEFYMDDIGIENAKLMSSEYDLLKDLKELYLTAEYEYYFKYSLWDKVVDFKLVYCKEWDMWFEIKVDLDETNETVKTVFCTQLGQAELSQIMLYDIEINTEDDIARDDYKISILYDKTNSKASILDRLLEKAPHYSIIHVDSTISNIQRSFSFDNTSIYNAFQEIAEEIGCLFVFHSNSDENGNIQRTISVYDLQQNCLNEDCGHRGEFTDVCPKCGGTNIKNGYGEDTTIFVTADELASDGIQFTTDVDSVKNCFKLEAGDDLMTATVRNCNPNGTDYIYYFSDATKEDMSHRLVNKIEDYDDEYEYYYNEYESDIDANLLNNYNKLATKYSIYNEDLESITSPIKGYSSLMNAYYNVIDLSLYLKSGLMPSVKMSDTTAEEQAKLLTSSSLSPVAVTNINVASLITLNNAVLGMAKTIVRPTYKIQVNTSEMSDDGDTLIWTGNFLITNYSDEEDTAISNTISVTVNDDLESFIEQKLEKALNKENTDDLSISGLFKMEYEDFCEELKKYALNPLSSFHDACQACIDILIEQGVGSENTEDDLYVNLYTPYYNKLMAIESEMKVREDEINIIDGVYDADDVLITDGLSTNIEKAKTKIQDILNFEKYLGTDLWLEFCSYRREDKYSNDNYISDGLNNAELFEKALEFVKVANDEIYKSSELQHSISTDLKNLLAIEKFKSLVKYFNVGNWIRVQIDNKIYKLRLLNYDIDFDDFDIIPVTFSDVMKIKDGISDVENVLEQAKSMATSYDSVQKQSKQGDDAKNTIEQWLSNGLNASLIQIQNNNSEDITMTKNGLLCRSYNDITDSYSPKQLKLTHNIMAYTDDDWKSVRLAIGEHEYHLYDEGAGEFVTKIGYGMNADFVTAGVVTGSQIIGGDIYSDNYSTTNKTGSYLNLRDGTFSFGGGSLRFEGGKLLISSPDIPTTETITEINEEYLKTTSVYAQNLQVGSANINGQLTASQINTEGLIAENISGTTITGKTITGSTFTSVNSTGDTQIQINGAILDTYNPNTGYKGLRIYGQYLNIYSWKNSGELLGFMGSYHSDAYSDSIGMTCYNNKSYISFHCTDEGSTTHPLSLSINRDQDKAVMTHTKLKVGGSAEVLGGTLNFCLLDGADYGTMFASANHNLVIGTKNKIIIGFYEGFDNDITTVTGGIEIDKSGLATLYRGLVVQGGITADALVANIGINTYGSIHASGSLQVDGTKSRIATTKDYGKRLLYCYETPSPMFGDIGEGQIDETGKCFVFIDDVFAETIDTDCKYQVFLQPYGKGECYIIERNTNYFVVEGTENLLFGWEIKAIQKDFDTMRLEEYAEYISDETSEILNGTSNYLDSLLYDVENTNIESINMEKEDFDYD